MTDVTESAVRDPKRLAALHRLRLLDTPAEAAFDRLAKLASRILNAPVALVSLVDRDRQFFKSCIGLPEPWSTWRETPLSHSFCQHVVANGKALIIPDARRHPELLENLAIEDLGVVAYLGCPLITPDGQVIGSFCVIDHQPRDWTDAEASIVRDIAASVLSEIELRQARDQKFQASETRFHAILNALPSLVWVAGPDKGCTYFNQPWLDFRGRTLEQEQGNGWAEGVHPDDRERCMRIYIEAFDARRPFAMEYRLRNHAGEYRWILDLGRPYDGPDGRFAGYVGGCVDITARMQYQEALRAKEKQLRFVMNQAPVLMAHIDRDKRYKFVNKPYANVFGLLPKDIIGKHVREVLGEEAYAEASPRMDTALAGNTAEYDLKLPTALSGMRSVHAYYAPQRDASQRVSGFFAVIVDNTERERAQRELRESEVRFRATFEQAAVGIVHVSPEGQFLRVNDKFCAMLGYTRAELLAWKFQDITHPEDLESNVDAVRQLLAGEQAVYTTEKRYRHQNGKTVWARLTVSLVRDDQGKPEYFIAVVEDISTHQRAQQAIARSEALLAEAQRVAHFGSFEWSVTTGELRWSRELHRIYGLDPRDFSPTLEGFLAHVHPDDRAKVQESVQHVLASGDVSSQKERIVRPDGTVRVLETVITPVKDEQGHVIRLIGVCHDITPRERVDEVVAMLAHGSGEIGVGQFYAECVRQLASVYNARYAFIGRLIEPDKMRIETMAVWADDLLAENFSYDLEGTPCQDVLNLNLELIPRDVAKRYPRDAMLREMGAESYFGAPVVGRDGKTVGLVSVMDVRPMEIEPWVRPVLELFATRLANEFEREKRMTEREQLLAELTVRNDDMENFLYTISHDLKAPLITISGFASLLENDIAAGDIVRTRDSLGEIQKAVTQMTKHIQDLLLLSRIGHVKEDRRPVALNVLIESVLSAFAPRLDETGASVRLVEDFPTLVVDYKGFVRVFNNLIDNAIKYRHTERKLIIEIGAERVGDEVRLYVRDNGQGIKPEYHAHIFGMFQRADSRTEGAGVGLAISKRVIEQHGGRLWVESEPGKGSTFWIALPVAVVVNNDSKSP